jgi:hypothetical protein
VFSISTALKKNGTLAVTDLDLQLMREQINQIKTAGALPDNADYLFDELNQLEGLIGEASEDEMTCPTTVCKTRCRTVVTLKHGRFSAREVVRQKTTESGDTQPIPSCELARLVAPGCRYGYDLVAHVGLESFLFGRRLQGSHQNLRADGPSIDIPTSSLDELRRRFLFYLGQVHRHAAPVLRESLSQAGDRTWLIDGTLEPGTPVFFGVQDAASAILLGCWKIPTENADAMAPCLEEAARDYGQPDRVLHDLSNAMSLACQRALPDVPHDVCHFHFVRDVGEGLLTQPQKALSNRLRSLKLQVRLREQRKTQTDWLREHDGAPEAELTLQQLLRGEPLTVTWSESLGREVLFAFHFWMLDYAADGKRQGFPFDPYFLYFHRRLIRGHDALERLLSRPAVKAHAPKTLFNLFDQLKRYRADPQIIAAATHGETAFREFDRLRTTLQLSADGTSPMHHGYDLPANQRQQVREALDVLCDDYRQRIECSSDEVERSVCRIILLHVEKYLPQLLPPTGQDHDNVRTTNQLEGHWGEAKRACRQTQGRRKLTRSFDALPAELMLIPNLRNSKYIDIVLGGSLDHLATKFAEANSNGSSYATWRQTNTSLNLGRIPSRILRQPDFVEHVTEVYTDQCRAKHRKAA